LHIIKKDGTREMYDEQKIITACNKSASRAIVKLSDEDLSMICNGVWEKLVENDIEDTDIHDMHNYVESTLEDYFPKVAATYKEYRNYKKDFVHMMDKVYEQSQKIRYIGDRGNANTDSALVATQRSLIYNELNSELYKKFFLTLDERQAAKDGYIYIHDRSARLDTMNCCNFLVGDVMRGGFEMGNVWYNEPNTLDTAFDVMGDIIMSAASCQYGGFTVPRVDSILAPYAKKSYKKYVDEYIRITKGFIDVTTLCKHGKCSLGSSADKYATAKVKREFEQGWQGIEYKLNTVGSSRGDYPFTTMTFGLDTSVFGKMASITFLDVHKTGQGKKGQKKPVLFPKLVFLYDENLHAEGKENHDVFLAGIECSMKTMYPDWLSLSGEGYVPEIYKKYGEVVSPMGCRAFLSPWYERGGITPEDDNDKPVFEGRWNLGAISLHICMIYAKAEHENRDFYEVLDEYLELIHGLHKRTFDYLGEMKASTNPLAYCEGGFYGGTLKPDEKIKPIMKSATISFGITALNELQQLYNGTSIYEDGKFALEVMQHINDKLAEFKDEDGLLYAVYGTPAESLAGLQVEQFRKKYGIIENISDREYMSNSFHCHVAEDITPIQKQDSEKRFWDLFNGGKIQYVKYTSNNNKKAFITLIERAMKLGLYEGVNLSLGYCEKCGHEELSLDVCPKCGSEEITRIDRAIGYLGYTRIHGNNRFNKAKSAEIKDRVSM